MKQVNITKPTEKGMANLQKELDLVQKRCKARTITIDSIRWCLTVIEDRLHMPKKDMHGIKASVDYNAQSFPNAYRGAPESTWFDAEYKNGCWYIKNIYRSYTASPNSGYRVGLTDEAKRSLIRSIERF